jgi:hypothetical protein
MINDFVSSFDFFCHTLPDRADLEPIPQDKLMHLVWRAQMFSLIADKMAKIDPDNTVKYNRCKELCQLVIESSAEFYEPPYLVRILEAR